MRSAVTLHLSTALHSIAGRSSLQSLNHFPPPHSLQDHVPALGGRVLLSILSSQTGRLSTGTSALTVCTHLPRRLKSRRRRTLRLAAVALGTARCPCGIDDTTIRLPCTQASPWRHHPICSSGRTGTVCTFLDSASSMRAFSCVECEVVHLGLPEQVREAFWDFMALARWGHLPLLDTAILRVVFMMNPTTPWQTS